MSFASRITQLPIPMDPDRGASALAVTGITDAALGDLIRGAAGSSPYLAGLIGLEAEWLAGMLADPDAPVRDVVRHETQGYDALAGDALGPALRRTKRRVALWTALADLGGNDQIAFVFAVLVIDKDEHAAVAGLIDDVFGS